MKLQIDIQNYKVNYIGFEDFLTVRKTLKYILPLDYLNIALKEGLELNKWKDAIETIIKEGNSNFRYSMKVGILLDDAPSIVRTYRDKYYNLYIK